MSVSVFTVLFSIAFSVALFNTYLQSKGIGLKGPLWFSLSITFLLPVFAFVCLDHLAGWLYPLMPGFAVYSGEVSFIRRDAPEIGFFAFLMSIAGLIIAVLPIVRKPPVAGTRSVAPQAESKPLGDAKDQE